MTTEPVRAGSGWLALREPADAAARSAELVEILRPHLPTERTWSIHDLGCGTGSMARWLAPQLSGPQRWVLHDRDAELLEHAATSPPPRSADGAAVTVETRLDDITRLGPGDLAGVSLITASALLDMFTDEELDRFVAGCAGAGCPVLVTLSVVGHVELAPAHPFDRQVMDAFNAHQRRRTAGGRLLGPDAAGAAAAAFRRRGLEVIAATEPVATRSRARRSRGGVARPAGSRRPASRRRSSPRPRDRTRGDGRPRWPPDPSPSRCTTWTCWRWSDEDQLAAGEDGRSQLTSAAHRFAASSSASGNARACPGNSRLKTLIAGPAQRASVTTAMRSKDVG